MKITLGQVVVLLLTITGRLPLWACRLLGRCVGFFLWLAPTRSRATTNTNIALCFPEYSNWERRKLAFHSLQHTGMLVFEMAIIWHRPYNWLEQRITTMNKALFDEAQRSEKGLVILLPHVGNWEVFSRFIPAVCDGVGLYEPPRLPELDEHIKKSREKTGAKMVPTNVRGVAALLKHLRGGGTTCVLPDQVPNNKKSGGVYAPFFGHPAYTMTLVTQLYQRSNCIVMGATAKRVPGGFEMSFYPVDEDVYSGDEVVSAQAINQLVETCAREIPEQYQWEYKRFRRQPQGSPKIY